MQTDNHRTLKTLCCQIESTGLDIQQNINKVKVSLLKYTKDDELDVIMFPECSFSNYCISKEDASKIAEIKGQGQNYEFAKQIAIQTNSYVIVGYVEKDNDKLYNSALMVDRNGQVILNHRKKLLYDTDKEWAQAGDSFQFIDIINTKGQSLRMGVAICMDINYYEFIDPNQFELGDHLYKNKCDGLLFISAWVQDEKPSNSNAQLQQTINYWIYRLLPVLNSQSNPNKYKQFLFVCCNRVGQESKYYYVGTSCVVKLNPPQIINVLNVENQGYLAAEVKLFD